MLGRAPKKSEVPFVYIQQFIFIFVAKSFHFCEEVVRFLVGDTLFFITYNFLHFYAIYAFRIHTTHQLSLYLDCFSAFGSHLNACCFLAFCSHLNADCHSTFNSHFDIILIHFQNFQYFVFAEIVS